MKDPIVYVEVSEKEKLLKALAVTLEPALASTLKNLTNKDPHCSLVRLEKTSLQALLKSTPMAACALEVRYHSGLEGTALLLCRSDDLVSLGELLAGVEAKIGDTLSPELIEACLPYFNQSVRESCRIFSAKNFPIGSDTPELINPDGRAAGLGPLSSSYEGVPCATFELSLEPKLDCRLCLLADNQLMDSLMLSLPDYDPNPQVVSAAAQRIAARRQRTEEPGVHIRSGVESDAPPPTRTKPGRPGTWNIDLLLDVELPIAVSFGDCEMPLRDVLKLAAGSVIELDKSVNDPVTLIVNQKPIARGEVVMIDGNYGVRITEVESTAERIRSLGAVTE